MEQLHERQNKPEIGRSPTSALLKKTESLKNRKEKQEAKHNTGELFQMRLIMETFRMFETLWEA